MISFDQEYYRMKKIIKDAKKKILFTFNPLDHNEDIDEIIDYYNDSLDLAQQNLGEMNFIVEYVITKLIEKNSQLW